MTIDFRHNQSAHCENGSTANLLRYYGIDINESLAFGIGSGLFFAYLPFIRINHIPVTSFRPMPGMIFKRTAQTLGVKVFQKKFRDREASMAALDAALAQKTPVGLQVGVFHLAY
ncbi:MAG: BtrH N-terminal domain-containing protein, partial [Deltaproteobacteria bacterium]|nr:BtrH N-terminal domain-containing protein [Deltaproteobacteria bacterium]